MFWDPEKSDSYSSGGEESDNKLAKEHYLEVSKSRFKDTGIPLDENLDARKVSRKELEEEMNKSFADKSDRYLEVEDGEETDSEIEGLEQEDSVGEDQDSNGNESDEEDLSKEEEDETIPTSSGFDALNLIEKTEEQEKQMIQNLTKSAKDDREKGKFVKTQLGIWESLLNFRIKYQPILDIANSFPQPDQADLISDGHSQKIKENTKGLVDIHIKLLNLFLNGISFDIIPKSEKKQLKRKHDSENIDEWIENSWANLSKLFEKIQPNQYEIIEKWNNKVQVANGISTQKKFKVLNTSIVSQLKNLENDRERLIKRTRLNRNNEKTLENGNQDYHNEIYDDGDYYQQLLKELIESRITDLDDPSVFGMRYAQLKQLQSKKKPTVERKASKGRKIRYHVHEKIQNFMGPEPAGTWHDEMVEELFNGLFGNSASQEPIKINDGFKIM